MVTALVYLILSSIAVFVSAYLIPGIHVENFGIALVVAVVMGFVNTFIRPIIFLLTLPLNVLTLGLFTFVILGFLVMLVSFIVPGFTVSGFFSATIFAVVLAIVNGFILSWADSYK